MPSVLSTRILDASSKNHLLHAGLALVEYDAIHLELRPPALEINPPYTALLFTSKNGFRSFLLALEKHESTIQKLWTLPVYCVGESTAELIHKEGFPVTQSYLNAASMAQGLSGLSSGQFAYFAGNIRQEVLPKSLREKGILFKEFLSYQTVLKPKSFLRSFEAILFFSPSGVRSHLSKNDLSGAMPICIGSTTAKEIRNYTEKYLIAKKPTLNSVVLETIKHFKAA